MDALTKFRNKAPIQAPERKETPSAAQETFGDIKETVSGVGREFKTAGEEIVKTATSDIPLHEKVLGVGAKAFRGGSRAFGELVIGAGKSVLPQTTEDKIARIVEEAGQKIGESPATQNLMQRYNSLTPSAKRNVDNALGFAEGLSEIFTFRLGGKLGRKTIQTAVEAVEKAAEGSKHATQTIRNTTPNVIKNFLRRAPPGTKEAATEALTDAYKKSFVVDNVAVNRALDQQARELSHGAIKYSKDDSLVGLAKDGYMPVVEGKLASFDNVIDDISARQGRLAEAIDPLLATVPERTTLTQLKNKAAQVLRRSPQVGAQLKKSLRELDSFFDSFQTKYGNDLSALEVNDIRKEMNRRTKAFGDEMFMQDTADAVADATRARIDEMVPDGLVRQTNAEIGRLFGLQRTAEILNNRAINIGILGGQVGRLVSTMGASGIGLNVGGPGGFVIAGIVAHYGGEVVAQILRNRRFDPRLRQVIIEGIKQDDELVQRLIKEAEGANKEALERLMLPAPAETPIPQPPRGGGAGFPESRPSGVKLIPAEKGIPGRDPKTGKFTKTFTSDIKGPEMFAGIAGLKFDEEGNITGYNPVIAAGGILAFRTAQGQTAARMMLQEAVRTADNGIIRLTKMGVSEKSHAFKQAVKNREMVERELDKLRRKEAGR